MELVSFLEVNTFKRILQANFEYFNDGSKLYIIKVGNLIWELMDSSEMTLVHDRYQQIEEISLADIAEKKQKFDTL